MSKRREFQTDIGFHYYPFAPYVERVGREGMAERFVASLRPRTSLEIVALLCQACSWRIRRTLRTIYVMSHRSAKTDKMRPPVYGNSGQARTILLSVPQGARNGVSGGQIGLDVGAFV